MVSWYCTQAHLHVGNITGPCKFSITQLRSVTIFRIPSTNELLSDNNQDSLRILYEEILPIGYTREKSAALDEVKRTKLVDLVQRGKFGLALEEEVGNHPCIIPCRFFLVVQHSETRKIKQKDPFLLGGHWDVN